VNLQTGLAVDDRPLTERQGVRAAVAERLASINWDFNVRVAQHEVEGVHPYPAKFIADLPGAFLDTLPVPRHGVVMDPFCGSGTTLAEAQRRGYETLGVDLNPIACLIARVKTSPLSDGALRSAELVADKLVKDRHVAVPVIPNLDHWFKRPIQDALARLMAAIAEAPTEHQDFLRLAASSIIVRVSNQDSDTRYAAVDKNVRPNDVRAAFVRSCERLNSALAARDYSLTQSTVIQGDALETDLIRYQGRVGAIITSPPYPNAYEYWLYHKYRMWWLGFDPLAVKDKEIGARAHFFKKNHHTEQTFERQMAAAFSKFSDALMPGGWVCVVVGRSIIHGKTVDNARIVEDAGKSVGLTAVYHGKRNVLGTRKSFNLSHANIKTESVLVMQKPAQ